MSELVTRSDDTIVRAEPTPMMLIAEAVRDGSIDTEKMKQLMDLHERAQDRQAEQEYTRAMVACQAEMPVVVKDSMNQHTKSRYATLETIQKTIKPVYQRHGFAISFAEDKADRAGWVRIRCDVSHSGGHSKEFYREGPVDNIGTQGKASKTELHGTQSTVSYLYRQLLCSIFAITIANEDDDGCGGRPRETITPDEQRVINGLLFELGLDVAEWLGVIGLDAVVDIERGQSYESLVRSLNTRKRRRGATGGATQGGKNTSDSPMG